MKQTNVSYYHKFSPHSQKQDCIVEIVSLFFIVKF